MFIQTRQISVKMQRLVEFLSKMVKSHSTNWPKCRSRYVDVINRQEGICQSSCRLKFQKLAVESMRCRLTVCLKVSLFTLWQIWNG